MIDGQPPVWPAGVTSGPPADPLAPGERTARRVLRTLAWVSIAANTLIAAYFFVGATRSYRLLAITVDEWEDNWVPGFLGLLGWLLCEPIFMIAAGIACRRTTGRAAALAWAASVVSTLPVVLPMVGALVTTWLYGPPRDGCCGAPGDDAGTVIVWGLLWALVPWVVGYAATVLWERNRRPRSRHNATRVE